MRPHQHIELDLQFASLLSPWWLLFLVPLATAAAWLLYRNQFRGLSRWQVAGLFWLRLVLLAGLLFIAFKPSLIFRRILTYPGRIALVLDDSESMAAADSGMTDEEALRLARSLSDAPAGPEAACHAMASSLARVERLIRQFERYSRGADRRRDAFWTEAGRRREELGGVFDEFQRAGDGAVGLDDAGRAAVARVRQSVQDLRGALGAFFTGNQDPGQRAYAEFLEQAAAARQQLLETQAAQDRARLGAAGGEALRAQADEARSRRRLDLIRGKLERSGGGLQALAPDQVIQIGTVMGDRLDELEAAPAGPAAPARGITDLAGRVRRLLAEESKFPLSAVILASDGRDLGGTPLLPLIQEATTRQVPVFTAGVGSQREPTDLAVLSVTAPPFAVKGAPVRVRVQLKAALRQPADVRLEVRRGADVLAASPVCAGEPAVQTHIIEFTPPESGLIRYAVRAESMPGEAFATENNAADFVVDVRDERARVLLADWKPRWETRFALNILQRFDFVDLNSIIGIVQEGGQIARGATKGTWPENPATLGIYDLAVLGDLADAGITDAEWGAIAAWVKERGRTLCLLGTGGADPLPAAAAELLPVLPAGAASSASSGRTEAMASAGPRDLLLTPVGEAHPVTRRLAGVAASGAETAPERLRQDTQVLLAESGSGRPLVTIRFVGRGKVLYIATDRLWEALNPEALAAHTDLYVGLVAWALQGGLALPEGGGREAGPALGLDRRSVQRGEPVRVWGVGVPSGSEVAAAQGGADAERTALQPLRAGSPLLTGVFTNLPAGELSVAAPQGGTPAAGALSVVEDYPELKRLARDEAFLRGLASGTGGRAVEFWEWENCFDSIQPKQWIEKRERQWKLWGSGVVLALAAAALTIEWVWRKFAGLV